MSISAWQVSKDYVNVALLVLVIVSVANMLKHVACQMIALLMFY